MSVQILSATKDLEPLVEAIQEAADSEREAFGFLPPGAYREFIQQGRAIVAVSKESNELAGYCLYGGAFPEAKVFQTYVAPGFRGKSIGKRLVRAVFERLEERGYLSVVANVATDLLNANRFYEKMGFDVVNTKQGGKSKKRVINVRARELSTPSLLDSLDQAGASGTALALRAPRPGAALRYVIDLNVIFDVTKKRPRSDAAQRVVAAALENDVKLAITDELLAELEKHTTEAKPDPILTFCRSIPTLKLPSKNVLSVIFDRLRPVVFPEKAHLATLKGNDEADLRHLATAIEEGAAGFITSDEAILRAAENLQSRFGLAILSPTTFGQGFDAELGAQPRLSVYTASTTIEADGFRETDRNEVKNLLSRYHLSIASTRNALAGGTATAPRRRELVRSSGGAIAFASWDPPSVTGVERELYLFADETHPDAPLAMKHLLQRACLDTGNNPVVTLTLKPQIGQHLLRKTAISSHFYADPASTPRNSTLRKVSLGRLVLPEDWPDTLTAIETATGVKIAGKLTWEPSEPLSLVDAGGTERAIYLADLEQMFGPAIICPKDRPGVILPIWPSFAEELFHGSLQPDFLDHREAALKPQKAYIGGNYGSVPSGGLAFFYESSAQGGRKAITAVARIVDRYAMSPDDAAAISADRGVLPSTEIEGMGGRHLKTVIDIDTVMLFKNPIGIDRLTQLQCWDGANLVTAKTITPAKAIALLEEGAPHFA